MRDDYLRKARLVVGDDYILVNLISRRVKQLRRGSRPLVESLEKLSLEDVALREVAERRISYRLSEAGELKPTMQATDIPVVEWEGERPAPPSLLA